MIYYKCSDGIKVSQSTINRKYSEMLQGKHSGYVTVICECCRENRATDNSHIISRKRCKELHKTELIYDPSNVVNSCRKCHNEHESYKSGKNIKHCNYTKVMEYIKEYDLEVYKIRINS